MKTKNLYGFFLLTILACFYSCKVGDPIEGQNTFAVENLTDKSVELLYTFSSNIAGFEKVAKAMIAQGIL